MHAQYMLASLVIKNLVINFSPTLLTLLTFLLNTFKSVNLRRGRITPYFVTDYSVAHYKCEVTPFDKLPPNPR